MKAVAYIRKSTSGTGEKEVERHRLSKLKITFTHVEAEEEFDVSRIGEVEELFADLLFERWLKEKGFSTRK